MSSTVAGRLAATTGITAMIIAATVSILNMYDVVGRTPFTTSDLLPAVAVTGVPMVALLAGLLVWWRRSRAGWLMIVFAALGWLAIMNVGISTTADGVTLSSHDVTAEVLAGGGALLVVLGVVVASRARSVGRPGTGVRSAHRAAVG